MKIIQFPNEILTTKCVEFSPDFSTENFDEKIIAARGMILAMLYIKKCIGLAAPQVGIAERFFVMRTGLNDGRMFFDPMIVGHGRDLVVESEGCMSLGFGDRAQGGIFRPVPRWRVITGDYINEQGQRVIETFKGQEARIWQHEVDHLNGLLIIKTNEAENEQL